MKKHGSAISMAIKYSVAAILIVFAVVPFFWIVATSFNAAKSLLGAHLIPQHLTWGNYADLLTSRTLDFSRWVFNSFKVSLISVLLIVSITCLSAYSLSRFHFRGKKAIMMIVMILNVFPGILAMIAIYTLLQQIGTYVPFLGLNTHGGLICIYVAGSMSVNVLMVKAYIDTIPMELDESALIEGATSWQTFWKIVFPIIRPMFVTIGILAFMATYGDFVVANLLLKGNENITVMVGIFQFTQQRFDTNWGQVTAGTVIAALPVVILFFSAQKQILAGLTTGAVKD
jgi:ABC-type maltose transport system permease subunit